jgi:hypothetical protein
VSNGDANRFQGSRLVCAARGRGLFHLDLNSVGPGSSTAFQSTPFPADLQDPDVMSLSTAGGSTVAIAVATKSALFEVTASGLSTGPVMTVKGEPPLLLIRS